MKGDEVIRAVALSKSVTTVQGELQILRNIDFSAKRGEISVIAGSSGAGKSTLMNILGLLDTMSTGSYLLEGNDVCALSPKEKRMLRADLLGYIFQDYNLLNYLNAFENVMLSLFHHDLSRVSKKQKVMESLENVFLESRAAHYPATLSGGERQRLAIARCMAADPQIIFADEPTGNVDAENETAIMGLFSELAARGKTIIIVTHSVRLREIADKIYSLKHGYLEAM